MKLPHPFRVFLCFTTPAFVACGSGGGGGGVVEPPIDDGFFTVTDFAYADPNPPDFHLLSANELEVAERAEVLSLLSSEIRYFDDEADGQTELATGLAAALPAGFVVSGGAAGELDGVPGDELVLLGRVPGPGASRILCHTNASGDFQELASFSLEELGLGALVSTSLQLETADLDRDGRDELVVSLHDQDLAFVLTFDPLALAFTPSFVTSVHPSFERFTLVPGDFDDDLELELFAYLSDHVINRVQYRFFDGPASGHAALGGWLVNTVSMRESIGVRIQFDDDPKDEIAFANPSSMGVFEVVNGSQLGQVFVRNTSGETPIAAAAADLDGDGLEELLAIYQRGAGLVSYSLELRASPDSLQQWDSTDLDVSGGFFSEAGYRLIVADGDADTRQELFVQRSIDEPALLRVEIGFSGSGGAELRQQELATLESTFGPPPTALVAGDFDGDSLRVRYLGLKTLTLADPVPLVLLAAPPTKAGISQNYDGTSSAFGHSSSTEVSTETSDGVALSVDVGVEHKFAVVEASFKLKFGFEYKKTTGRSTSTTTTRTYSGGHDADVIVFLGILYQQYHYEVVSAADPELIGQVIQFDDPVARRLYKWTLPYYESTLPAEFHLSSLLTGTKGDPESYMDESAATAKAGSHRAWMPAFSTVGQGSGAIEVELALEESNSTTEEKNYTLGAEAGFKVGSFSATFGLAWVHSDVVEISTATGDTFTGAVGDILDPADYGDWAYDFGLLVYRPDLNHDGSPIAGVMPLWVVDYWTRPFGFGY